MDHMLGKVYNVTNKKTKQVNFGVVVAVSPHVTIHMMHETESRSLHKDEILDYVDSRFCFSVTNIVIESLRDEKQRLSEGGTKLKQKNAELERNYEDIKMIRINEENIRRTINKDDVPDKYQALTTTKDNFIDVMGMHFSSMDSNSICKLALSILRTSWEVTQILYDKRRIGEQSKIMRDYVETYFLNEIENEELFPVSHLTQNVFTEIYKQYQLEKERFYQINIVKRYIETSLQLCWMIHLLPEFSFSPSLSPSPSNLSWPGLIRDCDGKKVEYAQQSLLGRTSLSSSSPSSSQSSQQANFSLLSQQVNSSSVQSFPQAKPSSSQSSPQVISSSSQSFPQPKPSSSQSFPQPKPSSSQSSQVNSLSLPSFPQAKPSSSQSSPRAIQSSLQSSSQSSQLAMPPSLQSSQQTKSSSSSQSSQDSSSGCFKIN